MADFISDEEMTQLEQESPSQEGPDFISDDDMSNMESSAPDVESNATEQLEEGVSSGLTGGAVGVGLGKAAQGGRALVNKVAPRIGMLNQEQMDYITANADKYKAAPSLSQKLDEFRDLAGKTRQAGFDFKNQALQSLEGAPAVPKESYLQSIAKVAGKEDYSLPVSDTFKNDILKQSMSEVQPDIEASKAKLSEIDDKITDIAQNKPNKDAKFQAAQQAKIDKAEVKLERQQVKLDRINEKIASTTEKAQETAIKRREDFLKNQELDKKVQDIDQRKTNFVQTDKNLKKFQQLQEQLEDLKAQRAKVGNDIQKTIEKATKKAKDTVRSKTGIPESLVNVAPELSDRTLLPQVQGSLQSALGITENVDEIPAMSVAKGVIPALREGNSFDRTGTGFSEKFDTDVSEQVRKDFGDRFQDYDTNMKASADAIKAEEAFLNAGAKIDDSGNVILPESSRKKLGQIAASGAENFVDEKAALQALPQQVANLGLAPADTDILGDLKTSALKQAVKDTDLLDLSGYNIANVNSPRGAIKTAIDSFGTKAQEAVALAKSTNAAKIADKAIDAAPKVLGAAGLLLGGASAFADEDVTAAVPGLDQAESAGVPAAAEKSMLNEYQQLRKYQQSQASQDAAKAGFRQFEKMSNDDLSGLSQKVLSHPSEGARNYAGPLEKAANAKDERSKSAIMWGLYQQPAFRKIYKDINPAADEE